MGRVLLLSLSALLVASPAGAKAMKWMDASAAGLPAGAKMAVVKGDPGKAGDFTVRIKMPANYAVPPHHHPGDEVVRVVSAGRSVLRHGRQARPRQRRLADQGLSRHHGRGHEPLCVHHRPGRGPGQRQGPFEITTSIPRTIRGRSSGCGRQPKLCPHARARGGGYVYFVYFASTVSSLTNVRECSQ